MIILKGPVCGKASKIKDGLQLYSKYTNEKEKTQTCVK